jgi:hypothetical protein
MGRSNFNMDEIEKSHKALVAAKVPKRLVVPHLPEAETHGGEE